MSCYTDKNNKGTWKEKLPLLSWTSLSYHFYKGYIISKCILSCKNKVFILIYF